MVDREQYKQIMPDERIKIYDRARTHLPVEVRSLLDPATLLQVFCDLWKCFVICGSILSL